MMLGLKQTSFLNRMLVQGNVRCMSGATASIRSRFEEAYVKRTEQMASKKKAT